MKKLLSLSIPLIALTLVGCDPVAPTQERFVQTPIPGSLIDCDRLKRTKIDPVRLTNAQIALFITNRESIINECFQDAKDLRNFLAQNNIIIDKYNNALDKKKK